MSATPSEATTTSPADSKDMTFPLMTLPPELRLVVYRHYFDSLAKSKLSPNTAYPTLGPDVLSLLHSSSQVRCESAPIFYKECIGNAGSTQEYYQELVASDFDDMVARLKKLSASLAQAASDIIVKIRVHSPISPSTIGGVETKIRFMEDTRVYGARTVRFAKNLLDYMGLHIKQPSHHGQGENTLHDEDSANVAASLDFDNTGAIGITFT